MLVIGAASIVEVSHLLKHRWVMCAAHETVKFSSRKNRNVHFFLRIGGRGEHCVEREGEGRMIGRITASYAANVGMFGAQDGWIWAIRTAFISRIMRRSRQ